MGDDVELVNEKPPARSRFEAKIERREIPRAGRAIALIADVAGGLISNSSSIEPMFDSSRYRYRVHVIDRVHETVVHDEDWKGDEAGARGSFDKFEHALDQLNVDDFCKEYGIKLGSEP